MTTNVNQNPKYAIRKLVRQADGTMRVVYIDAMTGQQLSSLEGYEVTTAGNTSSLNLGTSATGPSNNTKGEETTAEKIKRGVKDTSSDEGPVQVGSGGSSSGLLDRSPGNNYGYIDAPNWLGLASFLPGIAGTAASAAKYGIRANDTAATGEARGTLGLDGNSGMDWLTGMIGTGDPQKVADVSIGDNKYSVGLEALNKQGMTTLTPMEARNRSLITGQPLAELTKPQAQQFYQDFEAENPSQKTGLLSGVGNAVSGLLGGIGSVATGIGKGVTSLFDGIFGDGTPAIATPDTSNYTPSTDAGRAAYDISPAAAQAIENGQGGLF